MGGLGGRLRCMGTETAYSDNFSTTDGCPTAPCWSFHTILIPTVRLNVSCSQTRPPESTQFLSDLQTLFHPPSYASLHRHLGRATVCGEPSDPSQPQLRQPSPKCITLVGCQMKQMWYVNPFVVNRADRPRAASWLGHQAPIEEGLCRIRSSGRRVAEGLDQ